VPEQTVRGLIATRPQFADEQAHALRHITESGGGIRVVSGIAGTGKTTLLHAARLAWELEGFQVHGAALAGQAASGLSREAGIASDTLHRTLLDLENGKLTLGPKSVLVVDEAGMVGTRMMRRTVEFTARAGALLVLTGEERQIQSIEAGGGFSAIKKRVGSANLVEIKRQREEWAREAVKDFADGESGKGLRAYAERGLVTVADDRRQAMEALVEAWKEQGLRNPGEQFILTGTRLEAAILNRMIQQERRNAGLLSGESVSVPDTNETLAAGDRILFIRKSRLYGVENGTQGDVVAVDFGPDTGTASLTVRTDSGDQVRFALQDYAHVRPGYASTTHKKQGGTTERTYILAGGSMQDRELSYVQASRARGDTRIFIDAEEAGENLTRIARRMSQSRQKEMAHTIQERSAQQEDYSQTMGY
jgi:Ti-type conjugative transfer relaxase TraA